MPTEPITDTPPEVDPSLAIEPGERDGESIADHRAATFGRPPASPDADADPADAGTRDAAGRFRKGEKHHAAKDKANREDVPRIKELSKENKELKERLDAAAKAPAAAAIITEPPAAAVPQAVTPAATVRKKPTLEEFGGDVEKWADARDAWNRDQWTAEERVRQDNARIVNNLNTRVEEARKVYPDFDLVALGEDGSEKGKPSPIPAGSFVDMFVLESKNGAHLLYALHKDDGAETKRIVGMKLPNGAPDYVAQAEALALLGHQLTAKPAPRRAEPPPVVPTPRPPTPIRTGPMQTEEEPPADDDFEGHRQAFLPKRRRR